MEDENRKSSPVSGWKKEGAAVGLEVKEKTVGYILAALGLVAGLAWNEAIKALIERFFPVGTSTLLVRFSYAVLITIVVVVVSIYLTRLNKRKENLLK